MKNLLKTIIWLLFFVVLQSCSPQITRTLMKSYPPLGEIDTVQVINIGEEISFRYEELGTIRVGDNGFGNNCGYKAQLNRAKIEAKKIGGNVIKVVEHIPPHSKMMGMAYVYYPCHEILVLVMRKRE